GGLAFFTLSLVSVQQRRSFPMRMEQVVRSDAEKAASKAKAAAKKPTGVQVTRRPGRPKGSKNTQIPSDLVVKSQVADIIDLILQLIGHPNGVHRPCRNRKSRGAVLSTSEGQWATTKCDGVCAPLLMAVAARWGVQRIVSLGAMLMDLPHPRPPRVTGSSTDRHWHTQLEAWGMVRRSR